MRETAPLGYLGWIGCIVAMTGALGCEAKTFTGDSSATIKPSVSQQASEADSNQLEQPPSRSSSNAKLVVADEKQFQTVVDGHRGKVVLVDFWATWCHSCVTHFPETVTLYNEHSQDGLAAVTVSFDSLDNRPDVETFLTESGAGELDNLISKYDGVGTEVSTAFDFEGVLPHYRLYDRTGKLRYRWDEPPADLEEKVNELLAESTGE